MKFKLLISLTSLGFIGSLYTMSESPNEMLIRGSEIDDIKLVQEALEQKADINYKDRHGWTALMWSGLKYNTGIVKLLLDRGANPDIQNNQGYTALMYVASRPYKGYYIGCDVAYSTAKLLLENGANPNIQNNEGYTALMYAAIMNHEDIRELLIHKGANLDLPNKEGKTAREYLRYRRQHEMLLGGASTRNFEQVRESIGQKKEDYKEGYIASILTSVKSAMFGNKKIAANINYQTNINYQDESGWTALMYATRSQDNKMVNFLLENGANPNIKSNRGDTALMLAANKYNKVIVELLLEAGADLDLKDKDGKTALDYARGIGNEYNIELIENEYKKREKLRQDVKKIVDKYLPSDLANIVSEYAVCPKQK